MQNNKLSVFLSSFKIFFYNSQDPFDTLISGVREIVPFIPGMSSRRGMKRPSPEAETKPIVKEQG